MGIVEGVVGKFQRITTVSVHHIKLSVYALAIRDKCDF